MDCASIPDASERTVKAMTNLFMKWVKVYHGCVCANDIGHARGTVKGLGITQTGLYVAEATFIRQ